MKTGYRSLTWVNDKEGHEYVCSLEISKGKKYEDLTEEEKRQCANVNQIVGTERW